MRLRAWLERLVFGASPVALPRTCLSAAEALALARAAAVGDDQADSLGLVVPLERANAVGWDVSSTARGRALFVIIDDATGNVIETGHRGLR